MHAMVLNKLRSPLELTELPERHPGPGQIRVRVAACGRLSLAMKSSAGSMRSALASKTCMRANGLASPGWATPAASANFAGTAAKICAIIRCSTATRATAVSRPRQSPMRASRFLSVKLATMKLWPHCFARV
jgi:hypothetical protein